jgi:hypothetical protein
MPAFATEPSMAPRMPTFAPELDLFPLSLAVLAAVLAPFSVFFDSAAAGRMRTFGRVSHRNLLGRNLRLT